MTVCALGIALMAIPASHDLRDLVGLFLVCASPGVLIGHATDQWRGAIKGGLYSGTMLLLCLLLLFAIIQLALLAF